MFNSSSLMVYRSENHRAGRSGANIWWLPVAVAEMILLLAQNVNAPFLRSPSLARRPMIIEIW